MKFELPTESGVSTFDIECGESIIFVGANGSGKSRLSIQIESSLGELAHRISAHRALNLNVDVPKLKEEKALKRLRFGADWDHINVGHRNHSRWNSKVNTFLLNDFDAVIQALFANQSKVTRRSHDILVNGASGTPGATKFEELKMIWSSLIPHRELIIDGDDIKVKATEEDVIYSASDMSDGERAIFYLIGQVLVAANDSLLIIDEPELHIHRSIMSSLWDHLEGCRQDCAFIFITHDLEFASSRVARKFAIKDFKSNGPVWSLDEVPDDIGFSEELTTLILGSRRPILFVEGDGGSLDKALYRSIYPEWSILPVGSCKNVIHSVVTLRANKSLTRFECAGIIDADGYGADDVQYFLNLNIHVLPVSEIENVFLIPSVSREIAKTESYDEYQTNKKLENIFNGVVNILNSGSNLDDSVNMYCRRKIDRYIKNIDFSESKSVSEMKCKYELETRRLDIESIAIDYRSHIEQSVSEGDIYGILSLFDNKGMLNLAGTELKEKRKSNFESWLIRTLSREPNGPIVGAVKSALPEIPINSNS